MKTEPTPQSFARRMEPQAEALFRLLADKAAQCLSETQGLMPGDTGYVEMTDASVRNAVRLGELDAKLMLAMAKLAARSRHDIHVSKGAETADTRASERLIAFLKESSEIAADYDMPAEEQARIVAALEEPEFRITDEEMETADMRPLYRRMKIFKEDRSARRRVLLHPNDRDRLTGVELDNLTRDQFAQRLQLYALERRRVAEAIEAPEAQPDAPGGTPSRFEGSNNGAADGG